ncbi:DNA polymerase III subunit alpha [Pseudaquabacterium rugosum]|uniref:Error-prone DNA polymerase n=1 Tax=Pseudaquabacterium rugosum TaxID=2984194 RepID=A0ABU9BE14_9BURK
MSGPPAYAELCCRSNFSFLDGASHPEELVDTALARGYAALALTDECSLAGVVRAHARAAEVGLPLIIGATVRLSTADAGAAVAATVAGRIGAAPAGADQAALAPGAASPLAGRPPPTLVLLARSRRGYGNLAQWISLARRRAPKGRYVALAGDLEGRAPDAPHLAGLPDCHALLLPDLCADDADGTVFETLHAQAMWLKTWFGPARCGIAISLLHQPQDDLKRALLPRLAALVGLPLVAVGEVRMHARHRKPLADVLTATRLGRPLADCGFDLAPNAEAHLRSRARLQALYAPAWLEATLAVAAGCDFSLADLHYEYPEELVPAGHDPASWLRRLTEAGARQRYPQGLPAAVRAAIEHELAVIAARGYEPYFLTVADIVRWARHARGILCQGRGSAANSAVCYCLGVTEVDPVDAPLLFERFISPERNEPPDIDIDFEHQRREEVIQYLYRKYGRHRAALTAVVIRYQPRSALRDVGRALGLDPDLIQAVCRGQQWWDGHGIAPERLAEQGLDPAAPVCAQWLALTAQLIGFPRHLSQHPGGFVIARDDIARLVPVENAGMDGRTVIEWDKDDLDVLGLIKVDILALGMLSAIRRALVWVGDKLGRGMADVRPAQAADRRGHTDAPDAPDAAHGGDRDDGQDRSDGIGGSDPAALFGADPAADDARLTGAAVRGLPFSMQDVPREDPAVYAMLQRADALGVFQVESRAQLSMLPRLRPARFYDLVIEVAIVRPGPIQGGMVHPYLKRRQGLEPVSYPSAEVAQALERTLGVPIFQEQVMQLAILAADFTPGEADGLRRAMAAWKRKGGLGPFHERLVGRMVAKGYAADYAEAIFRQIQGFGEYGFPESHAASFALLVYVSAWLKCHHPDAFLAALLDSQPMGFYAPAQLVRDAREHGVTVRPVCVLRSDWGTRLEPVPVRAGAGEGHGEGKGEGVRAGAVAADRADAPSPGVAAAAGPALRTVRLGFNRIAGLGEAEARRIVAARAAAPFTGVEDLACRAGLDARALQRLAAADALRWLPAVDAAAAAGTPQRVVVAGRSVAGPAAVPRIGHRHQAAWAVRGIDTRAPPLLAGADALPQAVVLPSPAPGDQVLADYRSSGLSLRAHPLALLRPQLATLRLRTAAELRQARPGQWLGAAGLVTHRQRPGTARGVVFVTLEDETGTVNVIVWPQVAEAQRRPLLAARLLAVHGQWQCEGEVRHLIARRLVDHSALLQGLAVHSRDFH